MKAFALPVEIACGALSIVAGYLGRFDAAAALMGWACYVNLNRRDDDRC